jgi:hypothetical protein
MARYALEPLRGQLALNTVGAGVGLSMRLPDAAPPAAD